MNVNTLPSSSVSFQRLHRLHTEYTTSIAHTARTELSIHGHIGWKPVVHCKRQLITHENILFTLFSSINISCLICSSSTKSTIQTKDKKSLLFLSKAEKRMSYKCYSNVSNICLLENKCELKETKQKITNMIMSRARRMWSNDSTHSQIGPRIWFDILGACEWARHADNNNIMFVSE